MSNIYCTYFNKAYLPRGIVLIRSLVEYDPGCALEILCCDEETYEFFSARDFGCVRPVRMADFEARHPELVAVKPTRSAQEYFFTLSSNWVADVAMRNDDRDFVTYLDADMRFYDSPAGIFDLMSNKDIMICSHNFERNAEKMSQHGIYNVGWLIFRNSGAGRECLDTWARNCREWCYMRLEDGKFADQKYLNYWPERYGDRLVVGPKSVNLGPWGVGKNEYATIDGHPCINGERIVLYHFQGLRFMGGNKYNISYTHHHSILPLLTDLYEPYLRELRAVEKEFGLVSSAPPRATGSFLKRNFLTCSWLGHPKWSDMVRAFESLLDVLVEMLKKIRISFFRNTYNCVRRYYEIVRRCIQTQITRIKFFAQCDKFGSFKTYGVTVVRVTSTGRIILGDKLHLNNDLEGLRIGFGRSPCVFWADGGSITIGDNVGISQSALVALDADITIGDHTLLGSGVKIYTTDFHSVDHMIRRDVIKDMATRAAKPVHVGADCWLGAGVMVLKGVTIGDRAIIAAGSVVTKDIPDDCVAAGVPCKVIRKNNA